MQDFFVCFFFGFFSYGKVGLSIEYINIFFHYIKSKCSQIQLFRVILDIHFF